MILISAWNDDRFYEFDVLPKEEKLQNHIFHQEHFHLNFQQHYCNMDMKIDHLHWYFYVSYYKSRSWILINQKMSFVSYSFYFLDLIFANLFRFWIFKTRILRILDPNFQWISNYNLWIITKYPTDQINKYKVSRNGVSIYHWDYIKRNRINSYLILRK
jgi:hypothetical protein